MAFKVGDRVTVYRKVKTSPWIDEMNYSIRYSGEITDISGVGTPDVLLDNGCHPNGNRRWFYPVSALKYERK